MTTAARSRFAHRAVPVEEKIKLLDRSHPALKEGRTLFPSTVVEPGDRVLVSGHNQRKLGDRVVKGAWRGFPIFALTLEERKTCPRTCHRWSDCYGNAMPFSRRHAHGPRLENQIEIELDILQTRYPAGFVVRLHVLGDFYSPEYVARWGRWLDRFPGLRIFGYTAWQPDTAIGAAVAELSATRWDRFAIRLSSMTAGAARAVPAENYRPRSDIIVCPAQTGRLPNCGSCALCWGARNKTIAFMAHGMVKRGAAEVQQEEPAAQSDAGQKPKLGWLPIEKLYVDERYQRTLESRRSQNLIKKLVRAFNWSAFQAIVVAEDGEGAWLILDGQHRVAAARKRGETHVPAVIVAPLTVEEQARIFVSANEDRVAVTPLALHRAKVAARHHEALVIEKVCMHAGLTIPKSQPEKPPPGTVIAVSTVARMVRNFGEADTTLALCVAAAYHDRPEFLRGHLFKALGMLIGAATDREAAADALTAFLKQRDPAKLFAAADAVATKERIPRARALAGLLEPAIPRPAPKAPLPPVTKLLPAPKPGPKPAPALNKETFNFEISMKDRFAKLVRTGADLERISRLLNLPLEQVKKMANELERAR